MPVNLDKPQQWKTDVAQSVDMYNDWFMRFAPQAFRNTRLQTTKDVEAALHATGNLTDIRPAMLHKHPEILPTLRMSNVPSAGCRQAHRFGRSFTQHGKAYGR